MPELVTLPCGATRGLLHWFGQLWECPCRLVGVLHVLLRNYISCLTFNLWLSVALLWFQFLYNGDDADFNRLLLTTLLRSSALVLFWIMSPRLSSYAAYTRNYTHLRSHSKCFSLPKQYSMDSLRCIVLVWNCSQRLLYIRKNGPWVCFGLISLFFPSISPDHE